MMDRQASIRYGRALLRVTEERGETNQIEKEFKSVCEIFASHPDISNLMLNPMISQSEKTAFMDKLLSGKISPLLLNFLKLLIRKERFREVDLIQEEFHKLYDQQKGIQEVRAFTALPIARETKERLRSVLKKMLHSEIRLITETDPDLLGGLILRFDATEIDASYRSRFNELKQKLMAL